MTIGLQTSQDYVLKKLILTADFYNGKFYDLSFIFNELKIQEDIFHGCITGTLSITDAIDLPQLMPFIGEEKIKVVFTKPASGSDNESELMPDYEMNFRVYSINEREVNNTKIQTYDLELVSEEFIENFKLRISRSFKAMTYSDMVQKIYDEKVKKSKPIIVEETKGLHNYISPNITPFEMFNVLASRSVSNSGNGECFAFYEDKDEFHYVSLGQLMSQPATGKSYIYRPTNLTYNDLNFKDAKHEVANIEKYVHKSDYNVLKNLPTGMYASKVLTVDILRQKINEIEFDLDTQFGEFKHLHSNKYWTGSLDALHSANSHVKYVSTDLEQDIIPWIKDKDPNILPKNIEEYILKRTSQLLQTNTIKLVINVPGDPTRKVGQVCEFLLPQNLGRVGEEFPQELDKYFRGNFLITSAMHVITRNGYSIHMEIMKDSFFDTIEHQDAFEMYKNII